MATTKKDLVEQVDHIIDISGDCEAAHSSEDILHLELLEEFLPPDLWAEIERLNRADFERWCE